MSMMLSDGTRTVEVEWWAEKEREWVDIIRDWYKMALDNGDDDLIYEDPDRPGVYMVLDIEGEVEEILHGDSWYDEDTDVLYVDGEEISDVSDLPWNRPEDEED